MIETVLRKRPARHAGELGLFPSSEAADDDLKLVTTGNDVMVKISSSKNLQLLKYQWALATVLANAVDWIHDKEDGIEWLCVKARWVKRKMNPHTGQVEIVRRSLSRISAEDQRRLTNRMIHIILSEVIPGLKEKDLRAEVERMVMK